MYLYRGGGYRRERGMDVCLPVNLHSSFRLWVLKHWSELIKIPNTWWGICNDDNNKSNHNINTNTGSKNKDGDNLQIISEDNNNYYY